MYWIERIRPDHPVDRFYCENGLDDWLRDAATNADRMGAARTYVLLTDTNEISAYFSLLPSVVGRDELPGQLGRGGPDPVPSYLIAKLARDQRLRGTGLGVVTLGAALDTALTAIKVGGGRLILVDAIDESARGFYATNGFRETSEGSFRLVANANTIARSFGR